MRGARDGCCRRHSSWSRSRWWRPRSCSRGCACPMWPVMRPRRPHTSRTTASPSARPTTSPPRLPRRRCSTTGHSAWRSSSTWSGRCWSCSESGWCRSGAWRGW